MRRFWHLLVIPLVIAGLGCGAETNEGFTLLHVNDVASLLDAPGKKVTLVDANGADFREREGVIPGAVLLSSYKSYDVAKELPPAKDAPLVFYCADPH